MTIRLEQQAKIGLRLELDAGNTRIKWRVRSGDSIVADGLDLKTDVFASKQPAWLADVDGVWASSVHEKQSQWLIKKFPMAEFAITQQQQCGLVNSYASPSSMGVDRWLAMLAAWNSQPNSPHIVIDAGTAITLDIIDANGKHLGGYICPGFNMMKTTLLGGTGKVFAQAQWLEGREPGESTQQCVDFGIQDMVVSWIERHYQASPDARIWVSGGDGVMLCKHLTFKHTYSADLVLDGLVKSFNNMVSQ